MSDPIGAGGVTLTPSDLKILAAAFKHSQIPLKPDYKLMASELGYGNIGSASNAWSKVSKKILGADAGPSPRKAAALKKTAVKQEIQDDGEHEEAPQRKKRKATKSRYITHDEVKDEDQNGDDGGLGKDDELFGIVKVEPGDADADSDVDDV